ASSALLPHLQHISQALKAPSPVADISQPSIYA
ncbi:MAG: hypothetical protein ACI9J5_001148, partial [Paraglaciecola sp.]